MDTWLRSLMMIVFPMNFGFRKFLTPITVRRKSYIQDQYMYQPPRARQILKGIRHNWRLRSLSRLIVFVQNKRYTMSEVLTNDFKWHGEKTATCILSFSVQKSQ